MVCSRNWAFRWLDDERRALLAACLQLLAPSRRVVAMDAPKAPNLGPTIGPALDSATSAASAATSAISSAIPSGADIGEFIREQRQHAKLSLRRLAEDAGVSNPYLSQIERGLRKPSAEILQQLAKGLRISAEQLYVQAGLLEDRGTSQAVEAAIVSDAIINERQKRALLDIYASFVTENRSLAAEVEGGLDGVNAQADAVAPAAARTPSKRAAKKAAKRAAKQSATAKKPAKKPAKRPVKKTAKRSARKPAKKPAKQTAKKTSTTSRSSTRSTTRSTRSPH